MASTYLPHPPSSFAMNSPFSSLPQPSEIWPSTWSSWRQSKHEDALPTPPASVPPRRSKQTQMSLPPIAQFDRQLLCPSPLTPPDDDMDSSPLWHNSRPSSSRLPSPGLSSPASDSPSSPPQNIAPVIPPSSQHLVDWVTSTHKRSAHFIAEKTCEMICYLWFSSNVVPSKRPRSSRRTHHPHTSSPPYVPLSNSSTAALQFNASLPFIQFMQKLLETTQVSQSVIVLSLHYVYRLKERNNFTVGRPGSEFRVAVVALMMANKFVDDNTYTNKTWSEVSGIDLTELNKMEREFLLGVDFRLFVDQSTYESWLNLLKGLVLTKERDSEKWRYSHRNARTSILPPPLHSSMTAYEPPRIRKASLDSSMLAQSQRARSSSPLPSIRTAYPFTFAIPPNPYAQSQLLSPSDPARPGSKRSATDAFSPTSESFTQLRPLKRPTSLILDIDAANGLSKGPASAHPACTYNSTSLEPLQSFERMSLDCPSSAVLGRSENPSTSTSSSASKLCPVPRTLAAPYSLEDNRHLAAPQNLYFYALASSPMNDPDNARKAKLRYHQPPLPPSLSEQYYSATLPPVLPPLVVQSACTSPREAHLSSLPTLPHFHEAYEMYDTSWSYDEDLPTARTYRYPAPQAQYPTPPHHAVPPAPFANAGPPGVHFYAPLVSNQPPTRGRRF